MTTLRAIDPEALFTRARASTDAARAVLAELRAHLDASPADFDAWLTLGLIAPYASEPALARTALARAVELSPASVLARVAYARLLDPRSARRELAAARALEPDHAGIQHELALVEEELAILRRRERALGNAARSFADHLSGARILDTPGEIVLRTRGDHGHAVLAITVNDAGRIDALFFAIIDVDTAAIGDLAARASMTFLGQALAIDPDEAADLLERLGARVTLDFAGARVAFVTRDIPTLGPAHGLYVTRLPA